MPLSASKTEGHLTPSQLGALKAYLSPDVLQFCLQHEILQYVPVAMDVIKKCLPLQEPNWDLQVDRDPDTGEEWLSLHVMLKGEVEEILNRHDNYTDQWVSLVPWPERDKIRLSYNVV